jgi:hypothetical protein
MSVWSLVQSGSGGNNSGLVQITLGSPSIVGNVLVCCAASHNTGLAGVGDGNNTWTKRVSVNENGIDVDIWTAINAYHTTLDVEVYGGAYTSIYVAEFAPPSAASYDSLNSNYGTNATASAGNTTVSEDDLVIGAVAVGNSEGSHTVGAGYTSLYSIASSAGVRIGLLVECLLNTSVSPANPSATFGSSPSSGWTMGAVSFQAAAPPASPNAALLLAM